MTYECEYCKRFAGQSGTCKEYVRNCLAFEREPRGKKIEHYIAVEIDPDAETEIIKRGEKVSLFGNDTGYSTEGEVIRIEYIDFKKWEIGIKVYLFENDIPYLFRKKERFRVIQGGRAAKPIQDE